MSFHRVSIGLVLGAVLAAPSTSRAGLLVQQGAFETDTAFNSTLANEGWSVTGVAEGTYGNNALNGNFELKLVDDTSTANGQQRQFIWTSGTSYDWTMSFDSATSTITWLFNTGSISPVTLTRVTGAFDSIFIRTRGSATTASEVSISEFNSSSLSGTSSAPGGPGDNVDYLGLTNFGSGNWVLKGSSILTFNGGTANAVPSFQFKFVDTGGEFQITAIPEPTTLASGLLGAAILGIVAFKRRRHTSA
ncbi:choice-of-anchor W domain-containing protein [Tautonia rosea]|uniref:choice-of-anchor W domain-containing protein n=1 Tax=Tautonia rosea TaxID=2728037 RepID=UPI0014768061|nr:choice-of-anchor W domain-containing protein [Tautonia rosea]